ncbi:uncharacterized protein [Cicer arietinum]|uniref:Uncharacterized protein LOC101508721 n=1 Tax=Cicer arietinum TaxID=3827 RepID=A0A1S3EFY5_CICAR|nr:uncharacterized protein LOC101508721 [Cicer arietinum]
MDSWGNKMLDTIITVAEMAAFGFGLPRDGFTSQMHLGPHILASTGSDLNKYNQEGTVIEAYHHDLNLLTIHGSNRFPGLNIWLRNAARVEVKVPVGCFLIQAGKQFEWLTGGDCLTCKHEVVVTKNTINAINKAKELDRSLWRISATLYAHLASDAIMKPLDAFLMTIRAHNYLPVTAGDYVEEYAETNPNPSPNPN